PGPDCERERERHRAAASAVPGVPPRAAHRWNRGGQLTLESCAALCIAFNDDATLLVACDLGLLSHVRSALLSEIDVLADDGIVLLEHDAVRAVAAVLAGHVGVPGAGGRLELDDGTNILGLGHQSFTPLAI